MIQGYFKYWSIIVLMLVFVFQTNATENSTLDIVGLMDKLKRAEPGYEIFVFHQISELGEAAQSAGAQIEEMVETDDELSSAAAETLGWIGYRPGIPTLIEAMNSRNWELVYQAIWSLGRLRATEARESLEHIRDTHWSHLVAMEAQKSLDVLDQPLPDFTHVDFGSSAERFIQLEQVIYWEPTCQNEVEWQGERLKLETNSVLPLSAKPEQLPEFIPQETGKENRAVMKVKDGWLVGVSHGEFCSGVAKDSLDCGLHYFSAHGKHTLIVQGNIDGIYQTANNGLVVTEGVDHMGYSPGHVFKLTQSNPSSWRTELLAITQASPRKMAMAADGTLILQTQGSVVAVTQGGELKAVMCMDNQ
jgi:hypothetical protein